MRRNCKCTIYLLTNLVNKKIYVGQTWGPLERRMGKDGVKYSNSVYLYNAIQKHGVENFQYQVLEECLDQQQADQREQYWIDFYDSKNTEIGYNLKDGGSIGAHSEETKAKISKTLKAQAEQWTEEERARRAAPISGWWEGKERGPHTEEWKDNNSKMMIQRHATQGHPMQGKHHTEEAKAKISQAGLGRKRNPESVAQGALKRQMPIEKERAILQAYLDGMIIDQIEEKFEVKRSGIYRVVARNDVVCQRKNDGWLGKQHTSETKEKMAQARRDYWAKKKAKADSQ